jgi:heme-degrading monooxygenase HmoA
MILMVKIVEMDERITLEKQLEHDVGQVVMMNKFNVDPHEIEEFLQVFFVTGKTFREQPGFISTQLYQGTTGSTTFINCVVWESVAYLRQAFSRPEVRSNMDNLLPRTVMSPHLFKKVAVMGDLQKLNLVIVDENL